MGHQQGGRHRPLGGDDGLRDLHAPAPPSPFCPGFGCLGGARRLGAGPPMLDTARYGAGVAVVTCGACSRPRSALGASAARRWDRGKGGVFFGPQAGTAPVRQVCQRVWAVRLLGAAAETALTMTQVRFFLRQRNLLEWR